MEANRVHAYRGGAYIAGIPPLRWGKWMDCSYAGCETALLRALGLDISYEEAMGLSGSCYRADMREDWDPSSEMPQNGLSCEQNVARTAGIAVYALSDDEERVARAVQSLEAGVPVLTVGQRAAPEWCLTCGYFMEAGRPVFFGRSYFDGGAAQERHTPEGYLVADRFPGMYPASLCRFYDRPGDSISRREALKVSLETCLRMFEQPPGPEHRYGYDAYDILIRGLLLDDEGYRAIYPYAQYHIGSLQDARRAAWRFLEHSAELLPEENRNRLRQAAGIYRRMLENLLGVVPYDQSAIVHHTASPFWGLPIRRRLADALRENRMLENQVRAVVGRVLAEW
jgi:hypothetical protein